MENKNRIWKQTQRLYGVLILAYINMLDEMTDNAWDSKSRKVFAKQATNTSATVYHMIHKTQIHPDWEYLGVDKAWLRKMEQDWLTAENYHHRIGAYPTN